VETNSNKNPVLLWGHRPKYLGGEGKFWKPITSLREDRTPEKDTAKLSKEKNWAAGFETGEKEINRPNSEGGALQRKKEVENPQGRLNQLGLGQNQKPLKPKQSEVTPT